VRVRAQLTDVVLGGWVFVNEGASPWS
jgi:hypothetical protein